ncbi:uncharacterized protein FYW61_018051 isoform 2-T2 [Anableps anableps]
MSQKADTMKEVEHVHHIKFESLPLENKLQMKKLGVHQQQDAFTNKKTDEEEQLLIKEEIPDLWSSSVNQQNLEKLHIKKEEEELCTNSDGELINEEEETDDNRFPFTVVTVKIEDDKDKLQLSELHRFRTEDNRETEAPTSSSAEQMVQPSPAGVRTGWKELRGKRYSDEDQQMLVIKEEVPDPWSCSLDQQNSELIKIKEEEEELWISQEEKPQLSELHQIKTEDSRETEAPTSSSAEQMETEAYGENGGGPEPNRLCTGPWRSVHRSTKK